MVHYFKLAGQRMVLDEASGYTAAVDEITYKMLAYLTLPLPKDCPSAIRYDMAKYDSELVEKTYAAILSKHKAGCLYTDSAFDENRPLTHCALPSAASTNTLERALKVEGDNGDGGCVPVLLSDTDDVLQAQKLCLAAKERGAQVTVLMTKECRDPDTAEFLLTCDRLLVPETLYEAYRNAAPAVGVRLAYDVKAPNLLARVNAYADAGVTLMDAYPSDPNACVAGEQTALIKELGKVAKELFLRAKEGRGVAFLPFSMQYRGAKLGVDAFTNTRCKTCSHRMHCGGYPRSEADCEVRRACADAEILLALNADPKN